LESQEPLEPAPPVEPAPKKMTKRELAEKTRRRLADEAAARAITPDRGDAYEEPEPAEIGGQA
jgi:hypothetical protein